MQGGAAHRRAADGHRLQRRHRRQLARASHLHQDVFDLRLARARRELVGNRPARGLAGEAQLVLQADAVHLHHHAVNFVGQRVAHCVGLVDELHHLLEIVRQLVLRIHFEPGRRQRLQHLRMAVEDCFAVGEQAVSEEVEPPLRRHVRLQRAHSSRRGIARIGKHRQLLLLALFVHSLERLERHQQLATHLEVAWQAGLVERLVGNRQRNAAHGAHVRRHVFAGRAVAARQAQRQLAVGEAQRQRHAVELQLADVVHLRLAGELVHAPLPVAHFGLAGGLRQRQHRRGVPHLGELFARLAAHALRRRIRRDQLRMLRLQRDQLVHQLVERSVADLRARRARSKRCSW